MAVFDPEELAARMKRISELTETLLAMRADNEQARQLAERISEEIATARREIRLFKPTPK